MEKFKYCMPDGINSQEEHDEYLIAMGLKLPQTKENISLDEYKNSVNTLLLKYGWEETPSYQLVEMYYNQGKSITECVDCFIN